MRRAIAAAVIAVFAIVLSTASAEARKRVRAPAPAVTCEVTDRNPCSAYAGPFGRSAAPQVVMPRLRLSVSLGAPGPFIGGRLKCAVNVNAALAARGIRGTGSARAGSFRSWGYSCSCTTPGAVAIYSCCGPSGHVAIVADSSGAVWNPSRRAGGWQRGHMRRAPIACRCG